MITGPRGGLARCIERGGTTKPRRKREENQ